MKILIVGGGAREHALAWKLARDDPAAELLAAPGNPGIAQLARCVPVSPTQLDDLVSLAQNERVDFTVVGPEAPLAAGIVDRFRARRLAIFGPTRDAARIETSKRFAKELMLGAGVPTARASHHGDPESAKRAARELGTPVVIKASGLAAGKGVIIAESIADADAAIDDMLVGGAFGDAGRELLVEEFMEGEELSLFAITDGERAITMLPAQDHKRLLDGDHGPNTGGMGAYAPVSIATAGVIADATRRIIEPTLAALRDRGCPFTGLLYAGLMLTRDGPMVVEFNCRFGDPETEAILPLLSSSLLEPLGAVATGDGLANVAPFSWSVQHSVTTVIAVDGYPMSPRTGDEIRLPDEPGSMVFHAGTAHTKKGKLVTAGGRVFAVTAVASSLDAARDASLQIAREIDFANRQFRTDIGWRDTARHARAT